MRVRVRVRFSFLAAGSLSAALRVLAGACGLDFFRAPGEERPLLLQRPARSFARGETRESGKCAAVETASKMEVPLNLPRALVAPPKVVFAPPTTSSEACCLLVSYRPLATRD